LLQVNNLVFIHLEIAFLANIVACFSPEADTIINQSISLSIKESKDVSSQNNASIHEKIILAVTIAFHDHAINGFLNSEISSFSKFHFSNNSNAHNTTSSSDNKEFSLNFLIFSK